MQESFGQRVRRLREVRKIGLREAAAKVGISPTYLSRVERGDEKTPPAEEVIRAVATLLGDDFDALMQLAGRIPADVRDFVSSSPGLPQFLRTVQKQGLTAEELSRLLEEKKAK